MSFDKDTRNLLAKTVAACRRRLAGDVTDQLRGVFGLHPDGVVLPLEKLTHLSPDQHAAARRLRDLLDHYTAGAAGQDSDRRKAAYERMVLEISFTALNRLAALRLCEERGLVVECVRKGTTSAGFQMFERISGGALGGRYDTYRVFLECLFDELALDLGVLFDRMTPQSAVFPSERCMDDVLAELNKTELTHLWTEDETIGWVYQYFNPPEERKAMRDASQAPRNSRELAVRNQFFTPRYVVEFLTDNTLGRIWYEMRKGDTVLKEECRYLVRRPSEVFLGPGEKAPAEKGDETDLSQEELLKRPVYIEHRPKKDPRDLRILDPACGSGHFLLYAFDLLERIYEEAWGDPESPKSEATGRTIQEDFKTLDDLRRETPKLIVEHNLHGIDIDPRAVQIAALALWLRAQKAWKNLGLKAPDRPRIARSNIVAAEPMPGDEDMRREFTAGLKPRVLGQIVDEVFEKMKLAGEAGSLLKIEEEIKDAVAAAVDQWREGPKPEQQLLFPAMDAPRLQQQELRFDVKEVTDERFWDQAEDRILDALREYAEQAENGRAIRRRLFAEDAARGFAFIHLCRKRYDTVLMNPPYGDPSQSSRPMLAILYPQTYFDVYASFLERCHSMASTNGSIGAFTSRTFMNLNSHQYTRDKITTNLKLLADLGSGVLDYAAVETAAYVIGQEPSNSQMSIFFKIDDIPVSEKGVELLRIIDNSDLKKITCRKYSDFRRLPYSVLSYWIPDEIYRAFGRFSALSSYANVVVGIQTGDDERFVRLWYEIGSGFISKDYITAVFGGEPQKFYRDFPLLINWAKGGEEILNFCDKHGKLRSRPQNRDYYFREGLTFIYTGAYFSVQPLPRESIITVAGQGIFPFNKCDSLIIIGLLNSYISLCFAKIINPGRFFQAGYVSSIPLPVVSNAEDKDLIRTAVNSAIEVKIRSMQFDETSRLYSAGINTQINTHLHDALEKFREWNDKFKENQCAIDLVSSKIFGISLEAIEQLSVNFGRNDPIPLSTEVFDDDGIVPSVLMLSVGIAMGRWDVRIALDPSLAPKLPDPFDPLPVCPPGMLVGPDGLPAEANRIVSEEWLRARPDANTLPPEGSVKTPTIPDSEYPLRISWDGVLVDDPGGISGQWAVGGGQPHKDDIVRRVREVLEVLFPDKPGDSTAYCQLPTAYSIEQEACDILGVSDLRDYFRRPAGFFQDHLKRYSKSRRKAPIYWPLSTASGSYTIWLYYHRLNDQTLYMVVNKYVEPKISEVERGIAQIENELKAASGREATRLTDRLNEARAFLGELRDLREELLRIAALPYKPDLNDGVIINAAPLHKLFRLRSWAKDTEDCWKKLEKGDYDWAHLAYTIWPERVREVCRRDRSIAIAHGLEDLCEAQAPEPKKKGGRGRRKKEAAR